MARSPLYGIDTAATTASGRDTDLLGPSDSSDTGSDVAGIDEALDPAMPVDVALGDDRGVPLSPADAMGADSDMSGTGERRSAAGDAGEREAADIAPDRVFGPDGEADVLDDELVDSASLDEDDDEDDPDAQATTAP